MGGGVIIAGKGVADFVVECSADYSGDDYRWYRVYKSGWIEQGGRCVSGKSNYKMTATFLKPFKDTNYTSLATPVAQGSDTYCFFISNDATTYMTIRNRADAYVRWYACGF